MKLEYRLKSLALAAALLAAPAVAHADAADDCIAANEKSIELRKSGRLLEARTETVKCTLEACGQDVQRVCLQRVDEINASLPSIVFDVKDDTGADVSGVKVTVDGRPVDNATIAAVPLDPGEHKFAFTPPGQPAFERTFILREGERQRRERIVLTAAARGGVAPAVEGGAPVEEGASTGSTQRIIGLTVGGVGVVGLVLGGIFGLSASSKWSSAKDACTANGTRPGCDGNDPAQSQKNDAESMATLSTVFVIGGGVLAAGGAVLFFTAPRKSASTSTASSSLHLAPTGGARAAGLSLGGSF